MRETFLLAFLLGAAALAAWVALRLPQVAPRSFRAVSIHLGAALAIGAVLTPALGLVPGQPGTLSVLVALFGIALPALTYMFLAGIWLLRVVAEQAIARH